MRQWGWYVALGLGLVVSSVPAWAQGLFPGLEVDNLSNWLLTFFIGAVFTVIWYMIKRWISVTDDLKRSVEWLTMETKLHRQEASQYGTDIKVLKKRANGIDDWINKHLHDHAHCDFCPPSQTKTGTDD